MQNRTQTNKRQSGRNQSAARLFTFVRASLSGQFFPTTTNYHTWATGENANSILLKLNPINAFRSGFEPEGIFAQYFNRFLSR
jgi:hypothetical protein